MDGQTDDTFEALLPYMRDTRGFDFTGYKRNSLMRRVRHRMDQSGHQSFEEYLDVLQASSDEFDELFNTILINVTTFFRDPEAWDFVRTEMSEAEPPGLLPARQQMGNSYCRHLPTCSGPLSSGPAPEPASALRGSARVRRPGRCLVLPRV